jgi:aryl-alcohol dehydrogenase-like predicted oxidoreductase
MLLRRLGRSNLEVSALGLGCWAIGGPWRRDGNQVGWGQVDDRESIEAIHLALDLGVGFFDTAASYGCGHSERILGQALAGKRERAVIATKFGYRLDEQNKNATRDDEALPANLRQDCEDSLRRLKVETIDLYQFHLGDYDLGMALGIRDALEGLAAEGKIRWYGWSTDDPERARLFAEGPHCTAVQHFLSMAQDAPTILDACDEFDLASICRGPLGMGLLTGKFTPGSAFPSDDIRHNWDLHAGPLAERLSKIDALRERFSASKRSLAQVALGWIWARSERAIPIPGFKTAAQVKENVSALDYGPLTGEEMSIIEDLWDR